MKTRVFTCATMFVLFAGACTPSVSGVARRASSAAADEAVEEATDRESRGRIARAAQDPRIEQATEEIVQKVAEGVLTAVDSEEGKRHLSAVTRRLTEVMVEQMTTSLSASRTRERLSLVTRTATEAAVLELGDGLRRELGPALRDVLQNDIVPVVGASLNTQMNHTLGTTAQTVAYRAVLGANDGIGDVLDRGAFGGEVQSATSQGFRLLRWVTAGLLLLALILLLFAAIAVARAFRARADVRRLESATLLLATAMHERRESGESDEVVEMVRAALENSQNGRGRSRLRSALSLRRH